VTPQQAQELADLFSQLAKAHCYEYMAQHENHWHPGYRAPGNPPKDVVARLAKLLESVHAG
jgi:hypothetical protein